MLNQLLYRYIVYYLEISVTYLVSVVCTMNCYVNLGSDARGRLDNNRARVEREPMVADLERVYINLGSTWVNLTRGGVVITAGLG